MLKLTIPALLVTATEAPTQILFNTTTVNGMLNAMKRTYPKLHSKITLNDQLAPFVIFYCNGNAIDNLEQVLDSDSEVALLYAIAGG